mgnify:CR=1 FL=1
MSVTVRNQSKVISDGLSANYNQVQTEKQNQIHPIRNIHSNIQHQVRLTDPS